MTDFWFYFILIVALGNMAVSLVLYVLSALTQVGQLNSTFKLAAIYAILVAIFLVLFNIMWLLKGMLEN